MSDVLEIKGFDELLKALKETPKKVMPYLKKAMTLSVRAVQERVAEYPPSTEANQPGRISIKNHKPMSYYERGRGWLPPPVFSSREIPLCPKINPITVLSPLEPIYGR